MLRVWVQLPRERIWLQCRLRRAILHFLNHHCLPECGSELQLRIIDSAECGPNRPHNRRHGLLSRDHQLLHPSNIHVLSHDVDSTEFSLHYDHDQGGRTRTRGGGSEHGDLFKGIYNPSRSECRCSYTDRGLLCNHQRGWEGKAGSDQPRARLTRVHKLCGYYGRYAIGMIMIYT